MPNPISEYLLKKREEKRPGDKDYQQAKRTGIRNDVLSKLYKSKRDWVTAKYLMILCADIGITMEEAILRKPIHESDQVERLKKLNDELEKRAVKAETEAEELKAKLKKIINE